LDNKNGKGCLQKKTMEKITYYKIIFLILIIFFSSCRAIVEVYIENKSEENIFITCYPTYTLYNKNYKEFEDNDNLVDNLYHDANLVNTGIDIKKDSILGAFNIILFPSEKLLLYRRRGSSAPPSYLADKLEIRYNNGYIMAEQEGISLLFQKMEKDRFDHLNQYSIIINK